MKKEKDVDPTIHYAALSWFYLLHVFSKRIVCNLTTHQRYPCPALDQPSSAELTGAAEGRQQLLTAMGEIQLCSQVQISCFKMTLCHGQAQHGNTWSALCYGEISATENSYQSQPQLLSVQCRWHLPSLCSQVCLCLHTTICFRSRDFHLFSYPQISNHWNWSPTTEMLKATLKIDLYQRERKIQSFRLLVESSKDLDCQM